METKPILYVNKPFINEVLITNIELALKNVKYYDKRIEVKDGSKTIYIALMDILYIESEGNYINIVFKNKGRQIIREKLNNIETSITELVNWFTRVHQRYLINDKYIEAIDSHTVQIPQKRISISRKYKSAVNQKFNL